MYPADKERLLFLLFDPTHSLKYVTYRRCQSWDEICEGMLAIGFAALNRARLDHSRTVMDVTSAGYRL